MEEPDKIHDSFLNVKSLKHPYLMFTVFAYFLYVFYFLDILMYIFILILQTRIAVECNGSVCIYSEIPAFVSGLVWFFSTGVFKKKNSYWVRLTTTKSLLSE